MLDFHCPVYMCVYVYVYMYTYIYVYIFSCTGTHNKCLKYDNKLEERQGDVYFILIIRRKTLCELNKIYVLYKDIKI